VLDDLVSWHQVTPSLAHAGGAFLRGLPLAVLYPQRLPHYGGWLFNTGARMAGRLGHFARRLTCDRGRHGKAL